MIWSSAADRLLLAEALRALGCRRWQVEIVAPMVSAAFESTPDA